MVWCYPHQAAVCVQRQEFTRAEALYVRAKRPELAVQANLLTYVAYYRPGKPTYLLSLLRRPGKPT